MGVDFRRAEIQKKIGKPRYSEGENDFHILCTGHLSVTDQDRKEFFLSRDEKYWLDAIELKTSYDANDRLIYFKITRELHM